MAIILKGKAISSFSKDFLAWYMMVIQINNRWDFNREYDASELTFRETRVNAIIVNTSNDERLYH